MTAYKSLAFSSTYGARVNSTLTCTIRPPGERSRTIWRCDRAHRDLFAASGWILPAIDRFAERVTWRGLFCAEYARRDRYLAEREARSHRRTGLDPVSTARRTPCLCDAWMRRVIPHPRTIANPLGEKGLFVTPETWQHDFNEEDSGNEICSRCAVAQTEKSSE